MIIFIPGAIIATITFPGVILHEMAHKFFCDLYSVPVYKVKYFKMSKNTGHVIHGLEADSKKKAFIGLAPLLINSIVCFLFLIPKVLPAVMGTSFVSTYTFLDIFLIWVGISCGINAVPSSTDLAHIDNNISWPLRCIKRLAQLLNWGGLGGGFLWLFILFLISALIFLAFTLILLFMITTFSFT
jgi:hypothetical protein